MSSHKLDVDIFRYVLLLTEISVQFFSSLSATVIAHTKEDKRVQLHLRCVHICYMCSVNN